MSIDLVVRNATLPDGRAGIDLAIIDGRIVAVEHAIAGDAAQTIDAAGRTWSPRRAACQPFCPLSGDAAMPSSRSQM